MVRKKRLLRINAILLILVVFLSGCNLKIRNNTTYLYVLKKETCVAFFQCTPDMAEDVLEDSYWIEGHFQSADEDAEGNLVLELSQQDVDFWSNYLLDYFEFRRIVEEKDGIIFVVADDFKSITTYTKKEVYPGSAFFLLDTCHFCGIMQMLSGEDPNEWYVDISMYDVETNAFVSSARIPHEEFEVTDKMWSDAIENAQVNNENSTE